MSSDDWSFSYFDLYFALFISENPWLFDQALSFDLGCHDILFDDWWTDLCLHHSLLGLLCDHWLPELLMNNLAMLFMDDRLMLLMNDILVLLVDHWLVDLLDYFLVDDWLLVLMNDGLVMFMNNVLVVLMHDLLMLFMNHLFVVLLDDGLVHVLLHTRCLGMLYDPSLLGMRLQAWLLLVFEDLGLFECRLNHGLLTGFNHCGLPLSG